MSTPIRRRASPALAGEIESLWALAPSSLGESVIVLPKTRSQLIWPLPSGRLWIQGVGGRSSGKAIEGPLLCMPDTCAYAVTHIGHLPELLLGVNFTPGGVKAFVPAWCGEDARHRSLVDLWSPADVQQAKQRLAEAMQHSPMAAIDALEALLRDRRRVSDGSNFPLQDVLAALTFSVDIGGGIAGVAHQFGMNGRQLRAEVRNATGLAPKRYARLQRFARALRKMGGRRGDTDADIAAECGYFDQAHFVHEFKSMVAMTPTEYRRHHADSEHRSCIFSKLRAQIAAPSWPEDARPSSDVAKPT